nr:tetratricopeptide repeat protein [Sneathiella limimaris]
MADRAWQRGDAKTAIRFYSMASDKDPKNPKPVLEIAEILRKTKKIEAAKELYTQLVAKFPDEAEVHNGIGYLHLSQDKPYLATKSFEMALTLEENNSKALGGIALAMDTAGEHDKAHDHYRKAIKSDPNNLTYQNNLALSLALVGRLEQAIAMLEIITAHPKATAQHRQNLALVYGMAGKSAEAMKYSRMDLSERDARNNALYFQALNETPNDVATAKINGLAETSAKSAENIARRDPATSRQPYTPIVAREETTDISTNPVPAAAEPTALASAAEMANLERGMQSTSEPTTLVAAKSATQELSTTAAAKSEKKKTPLAELAELINSQREPAYHSAMADAGEIKTSEPKEDTNVVAEAKPETTPEVAKVAAEPVVVEIEEPTVLAKAEPQMPETGADTTAQQEVMPAASAEPTPHEPVTTTYTQLPIQTAAITSEDATTAVESSEPASQFKFENVRLQHLSDVDQPLYYIQLASFQTLDKARQAWDELTTAHKDLLKSFKPVYTIADLGEEKGTYYRVRIGGFAEKAAPAELCTTLKSRNTDCFLPLVTEQVEIDGEAIATGSPSEKRADVPSPKEPASVATATDTASAEVYASGYVAY